MERAFDAGAGAMRRDGRWHLPWTRAHLWPFTRALIAGADLLGVAPSLRPGPELAAVLDRHERALERYFDSTGPGGAYASDVSPRGFGTDRYHDDNAWVGLALIQLERLAPAGRLARAAELWRFAQRGWDEREDQVCHGGVFWIEQGRGTGRRNHDRNTVSTAPNAQLALHLAQLDGNAGGLPGRPGPEAMLDWVERSLAHDGLYWDKVRGDGSIDRAVWSYNQGSVLGVHHLLHRAAAQHGDPRRADHHLARAEAIARRSLELLTPRLLEQPAAFHAIWFRNLLSLGASTSDHRLREDILSTMRGYAELLWRDYRGPDDLLRLPRANGRVTLLDQSAFVQISALLAWDRERWALIA